MSCIKKISKKFLMYHLNLMFLKVNIMSDGLEFITIVIKNHIKILSKCLIKNTFKY